MSEANRKRLVQVDNSVNQTEDNKENEKSMQHLELE
jgi:hypothetical protein